jgi:type II secretory pathway pseudopilin PulG
MKMSSSKGFSLVETMIALGVMTTGVLGMAAVISKGMQNLSSSPADVVVTQKAAEAVEAVFSARDSHKLTWEQIRNTANGGIFLGGPQPLKLPGSDGLVNTDDDKYQPVEFVSLPGKDQTLGTSDDTKLVYDSFTREIKIIDITGTNGELRKIDVTVTYRNGPTKRTYVLTTYISAYS